MKVKQLSIFLENKAGRLREVTEVLAKHEINIRSLYVAETSQFGIVRLIVEQTDKARDLLKMHDFTVETTEVIAVEVDDKPGSLSNLLNVLSGNGINLEYVYAFVERRQNKAVVIVKIEDIDRAENVLDSNGIKILKQDELYQ